jgi:glycosyltransferase involved in cell wall biosynthesis
MRVAIVTLGRFHVLDLARELAVQGHEVDFWSVVPRRTAARFGLPSSAYRSLAAVLPLAAAHRFGGSGLRRNLDPFLKSTIDLAVARLLRPCDVFIGMSGITIESAHTARKRYGARVFIERGSRHILSQKQILDDIARVSPAAETVPDYAVTREQAAYAAADVVVVPARHTFESFVERAFPPDRLFRNPYGVDLDMFGPTPMPDFSRPTVVFVGTWSYQKGCDVLADAVASFDGRVSLLHVGELGDAPVPRQAWFTHQDAVPQYSLRDFYARAHVFALASRQEGLALVQAQALACGVPVVCTDRTGGEDLRELLDLEEGIFVVPHDDASGFALAIERALAWTRDRFPTGASRHLLGPARSRLSWRAYGERYAGKLAAVAGSRA